MRLAPVVRSLPLRKCMVLHRWEVVKPSLPAVLSWLRSHVYTMAEPAPGSAVKACPWSQIGDADRCISPYKMPIWLGYCLS